MGPLLPACTPAPAEAGAANGRTDRVLQDELVLLPAGLLLRAVDRQASAVGSETRSGPPPVQQRLLHHHIDIDVQTGGEQQHDFMRDLGTDHAKTGLQGSGDDGITDASVSTFSDPPRHVPTNEDSTSSTSDDVPTDGSTEEDRYNSVDEHEAASSTTSSAISSTSSLHSSASSEASTLTTASSRRNARGELGGVAGEEGEDDAAAAALVLIGCRMCLTYYMVKKPAGGCPRCGHQRDHIVRFGG